MKDVQRVAIVDPSDATREELRKVLLGMESMWLEAECARYEFFFDVISVQPGRGDRFARFGSE
jgi:pilus assembly protein CpaE